MAQLKDTEIIGTLNVTGGITGNVIGNVTGGASVTQANLNSEITRAKAAEKSNADNLAAEITNRKNGDDAKKNGTATLSKKAANAAINTLETGTADLTDNASFITTNANNNTDGLFYKRGAGYIWNWIKSKISLVLGLTKDNYGGKAATAATSDSATNDSNGKNIAKTFMPRGIDFANAIKRITFDNGAHDASWTATEDCFMVATLCVSGNPNIKTIIEIDGNTVISTSANSYKNTTNASLPIKKGQAIYCKNVDQDFPVQGFNVTFYRYIY